MTEVTTTRGRLLERLRWRLVWLLCRLPLTCNATLICWAAWSDRSQVASGRWKQDRLCAKSATQEDGYCDWCGTRRPEDMRNNPFAMWSPDGEFLGLGGGTVTGYNHQAGWSTIPDELVQAAAEALPALSSQPSPREFGGRE